MQVEIAVRQIERLAERCTTRNGRENSASFFFDALPDSAAVPSSLPSRPDAGDIRI